LLATFVETKLASFCSLTLAVASEGGVHPRAVDDGPLPVEVHELLQRQRVAHEVGRRGLEILLLPVCDRLANMGGEAGMLPGD
jgi:hypothetical protein